MSDVEPVIVVRDGARGELVLNRPARKNAINGPLVDAFRAGLAALAGDPAIGAILVRGAEGVFSSGLDLKDMQADPPPAWRDGFQDGLTALHGELFNCPRPIVAAVEAYAINAGAALALGADFMVIGEDAFFQIGEVRQGVAAPANLVWLSLKASRAATNQLVLLGRRTPGPEMVRLGLAHAAVPGADVVAAARGLADELAGLPAEGKAAFGRRGPLPVLSREP